MCCAMTLHATGDRDVSCVELGDGDTLVTLSGVGEHSSSADPGVVTLGPRLG